MTWRYLNPYYLNYKKQTNHENEISSQGLASHILWILPTFLGLIPDTSRQQERYYCYFSSSRWSVARFPVSKPKKRLQRNLFWPDHPRNVISSHICHFSIPYVEHMGFHLDQLFILNTLLLSSQGLEGGLWSLKGSSFMSLRRGRDGRSDSEPFDTRRCNFQCSLFMKAGHESGGQIR